MKRSRTDFGLNGAMTWIAFALAGLVHAQDLPDPGRRVFDDDRRAEQLKRSEAEEKRSGLGSPPERKPDARACEGSRVEVQMYCGAPQSAKSRSLRCAEAEALYRQNC
jgi:hypothetical protein